MITTIQDTYSWAKSKVSAGLQAAADLSGWYGSRKYTHQQAPGLSDHNNADQTAEKRDWEAVLRAPCKIFSERKFTNRTVEGNFLQKAKAKTINAFGTFHSTIAVGGERISRKLGIGTSQITYGALENIPLLNSNKVAKTIALGVGSIIRGITLAVTQLGHIAPYLAIACLVSFTCLLLLKMIPAAVVIGVLTVIGITLSCVGDSFAFVEGGSSSKHNSSA